MWLHSTNLNCMIAVSSFPFPSWGSPHHPGPAVGMIRILQSGRGCFSLERMRPNLPGTGRWRAAGALGEAFEHTKCHRMQLIIISNWAAERSAAFISLSLCSPAGEWDGVCPLTSQGCSEQSLTLKSVKCLVTEAVSAAEKPRRNLILVPEAGLNKQHHMLGSEQRWSFAWRWRGSMYPLAPGPTPFPEWLSLSLLLLSPLCAHGSTRGGVSALSSAQGVG